MTRVWLERTICLLTTLVPLLALATLGQESAPSAMEKLQAVQELVGSWHGSGTSDRIKTWDEQLDCQWTFGPDDEASLELAVGSESEQTDRPDGRVFESATLSFVAKAKVYRLKLVPVAPSRRSTTTGATRSDGPLWFAGIAKTPRNLVLDRIERGAAKDLLDRLDIKLLNDGDRLVYSFYRRVGKSRSYKSIAQVALDRQGTSLAGSASATGPKCIVTGGIGSMAVTVKEGTYYVCCTGCRDAFLANPGKFLARAKGDAKKP